MRKEGKMKYAVEIAVYLLLIVVTAALTVLAIITGSIKGTGSLYPLALIAEVWQLYKAIKNYRLNRKEGK